MTLAMKNTTTRAADERFGCCNWQSSNFVMVAAYNFTDAKECVANDNVDFVCLFICFIIIPLPLDMYQDNLSRSRLWKTFLCRSGKKYMGE